MAGKGCIRFDIIAALHYHKNMDIFLSLIVFGMAVFLFFMTNNKIKNIKGSIIIEDSKKELESLITEFNGAAARNIELLETRIAELQELLKKANTKMITMDERIERMNKPIVIEKIVEKRSVQPSSAFHKEKKKLIHAEPEASDIPAAAEKKHPEAEKMPEEIIPAEIKPEKPFVTPLNEMTRSEQIKYYLKTGKSKEDLVNMGFMENEVNLLSFLLRKGS